MIACPHTRLQVSFYHVCTAVPLGSVVQTYGRGLGGEPGNEAHGGYTFCGLAALVLVNKAYQLNLPSHP